MNDKYCVYKHTAPNGKIYIGITSQEVSRRWRKGKGYYQNEHFTRAILKYGWDNFTHEILFDDLTKDKACEKEAELIELYNSNDDRYGYNKSDGGECSAFGIKHSEETKLKMSISHRGRKNTIEHCKNISKGKKGKPNGREGQFGVNCSQSGIVQMIDESTGEVVRTFYGYYEMQRLTGYAQTPVKECVSGKRKRAYGYKWSYIKRGNKYVVV